MKHIFLIGFMGAGKTTVSKALRAETGLPVLEMDSEIERRAGMTISELFSRLGEPAFRQMETSLLAGLDSGAPCIVSCGGGTALRQENADIMRARGTIVYLTAQPATILARVSASHSRPLLEGHKDVGYISALLEARRPKYESAADLKVATDGKSARAIASEILARLR